MHLVGAFFLLTFTTTWAFQLFGWLSQEHIIGGSKAKADRLYQVSLAKDGNHFCGGAAISDYYVVTAAHCLYSIRAHWKSITVRGGSLTRSKGGSVYQLDPLSVKIMSCYSEKTHDCDVAVFRVKERFSRDVIRVQLVDKGKEPADETFVTVTGWGLSGSTSTVLPEDLQLVTVRKVQRSRCRAQYDGINGITENMICAGDENRNICKGDSGGPLVDAEKRLVGIVAWGVVDSSDIACSPQYHGVFSSVASPQINDFVKKALL